jgi:hypothetical protein
VVQDLVGIPPNFQIKKVTCNQVYTKVRLFRGSLAFPGIIIVVDVTSHALKHKDIAI